MKTLKQAKIGETVKVVKLHGEGAVKRRIMDMGITKGVDVYRPQGGAAGRPDGGHGSRLRAFAAQGGCGNDRGRMSTGLKKSRCFEPMVSWHYPSASELEREEIIMDLRIALAGNPNSGKTTLFNALTGSNQFVGNWPGVTVEKKEGKLKKHDGVTITDLPGIYSLSPYTLEEVVARNYLITERPDAILNIVDGTNLERNLYLTTQLTELGIPVVIAINMMDVVKKNGDKINIGELSRELGCKVMEISALKGTGIMEAAEAAIDAAKNTKTVPMHTFSGPVEHTIAHIEEAAVHNLPENQQRWYAIKIFERDDKVLEQLKIPR